jgi:hypothetical protein
MQQHNRRSAMNIVKTIVIAATALAVSGPAFAGRSEDQIQQHDRAVKQLRAQQQGLAGPVGERGRIGPGTRSEPQLYNFGHPTERVRR